MMIMKKAISALLLLSAFVSGAETSLRGATSETKQVAEAIEEFDLEAILRDMDARGKELQEQGVEPPTMADLLKNATIDDSEEEQRDRELQWMVQRNPTITDLAAAEPSLSVLYSLIEYCGLGPALGNRRAVFTVFAPRNHAFSMIDEGVATQLIQSREICNILLYHVIQGELGTNTRAFRFGGPWMTLHGTPLTTDTIITPGGRKINRINGFSRVHRGNIRAANGLIHIIRQVITPYPLPTPTVPPATTAPVTTAPPTPPATTATPVNLPTTP